jgi:subtilase family serine protease
VESALGDLELQDFFLSVDSQIVLRVSNPGGRIASSTFDYHLYQDGTLVASGSRPTPPMGTRPISTGYVLSGEHRIRAVIDPENLVAESNEGNNELTLDCSSASLICSPPP